MMQKDRDRVFPKKLPYASDDGKITNRILFGDTISWIHEWAGTQEGQETVSGMVSSALGTSTSKAFFAKEKQASNSSLAVSAWTSNGLSGIALPPARIFAHDSMTLSDGQQLKDLPPKTTSPLTSEAELDDDAGFHICRI